MSKRRQDIESLRKHRNALVVEAADALIKWRQNWESNYSDPPDEGSGQGDELEMWEIAGKLMDTYGIQREMP